MIKLPEYFNKQFFTSIAIIIVSFILYKIVYSILTKSENRKSSKFLKGKRSKTYVKLIKNITRYVFILITVLIVLKVNGVDVSSALAGVGIVGVILGLAVQDWLKDIIRGSSIISDHYFSVGDIVKYKEIEGKVLVIGLKSTKIQELKTGNIKTIANRNIEEIDIVSNLIYINIPIPYELPVLKAEEVISKIVNLIQEDDDVHKCRYIGVNELGNSFVSYCIEIECEISKKLQVRRDALRTALIELSNNNIEVPYTQIDIHYKNDKNENS